MARPTSPNPATHAFIHQSHDRQREVIRFAWDTLRPGGLFILMERLRIDAERLRFVYGATLAWLGEDRMSERVPIR